MPKIKSICTSNSMATREIWDNDGELSKYGILRFDVSDIRQIYIFFFLCYSYFCYDKSY